MTSAKKILLVDDSTTMLLMERVLLSDLQNEGYQFITAADGAEAVQKASSEKPALILMDVVMPRLGGFEACKRMRDDAATRDIPIIIVTTRGEATNVQTGFANGANDYVTKPIDGVELVAKVRQHLK